MGPDNDIDRAIREARARAARGLRINDGLTRPALVARIEQARESTLANTLAAAPTRDLIHPGVLSYIAEIGLTH